MRMVIKISVSRSEVRLWNVVWQVAGEAPVRVAGRKKL